MELLVKTGEFGLRRRVRRCSRRVSLAAHAEYEPERSALEAVRSFVSERMRTLDCEDQSTGRAGAAGEAAALPTLPSGGGRGGRSKPEELQKRRHTIGGIKKPRMHSRFRSSLVSALDDDVGGEEGAPDRIIDEAERSGTITPGGTIVEATSGNTGAGLAMVAALRGYKTIFVLPDKQSEEKRAALRAWGARVVVTPTNVEPDDPRSYCKTA